MPATLGIDTLSKSDTENPLDLAEKAVLVTGGGRGVGRGISECFLGGGADVLICGRTEPEQLPERNGRKAIFIQADVREPEQADACVQAALKHFGRLDSLVNNAGGSPAADAATASPRFSDAIVRLNLLAPIYCAQAANRVMQEQKEGGTIINIASVSAIRPSPSTAVYGAAKAGLVSLAASLAAEWGPKVRVNTIIAGLIRTEQAVSHYGDEESIRAISANLPSGRMGVPEDIGNACLFLASPLAAFVTGAAIPVHGGGEIPPYLSHNISPKPEIS